MDELSDDEAIILAGQGDKNAFSVLYQRYVRRIYNYIYYRTGSQHDAEDLTERVFFRAMNHIQNYHNRGLPFTAWLYRIAHNLVANWHRDSNRRREVPLEDHTHTLRQGGDYPEVALVKNQEVQGLLEAIRKLPEDRQNLIILKFVEHMSNDEIARIMGRSEGAIKSLYHRTLLSLRTDLTGTTQGED
ncbi:MAG TPA: sigma-70 family RNA polymerase sigma factor [Bellilinea sp.]|nr:sigma-70 family RNA polymerase sigma factor [Bellilinea sp.]